MTIIGLYMSMIFLTCKLGNVYLLFDKLFIPLFNQTTPLSLPVVRTTVNDISYSFSHVCSLQSICIRNHIVVIARWSNIVKMW